MAFVFYDTETTGIEPAFDQILQFAAVKTDDDLNEVDRFNIRCRLLPHVVPSPGALLTNRVTPDMLVNPRFPSHYDAIKKIRAKLVDWSPATFVGYNSIQFDEDILRQAFFQTLHPLYLTNTNGNTRGDVLRMAHASHAYEPDCLVIPADEKGRQIFKLDKLAPVNGFLHNDAHEALADVLATIHLARCIRAKAPKVWEALNLTAKKSNVIQALNSEPMLALTERHNYRTSSWIVTSCGSNPKNSGQIAAFDLNHDPSKYRSMSLDEIVSVLNASPKVIRSIRANAQPILMPIGALPELKTTLKISLEEAKRRADEIRGDEAFQQRVGSALSMRYEGKEPSSHVEKKIYDGFPSPSDEDLMRRFHIVDAITRPSIIESISDNRLEEFAWRLLFFENEDVLPKQKLADLKRWRAERMLSDDEEVPWMTIPKAMRDIDKRLKDAAIDDAKILNEMKAFLLNLESRVGSN